MVKNSLKILFPVTSSVPLSLLCSISGETRQGVPGVMVGVQESFRQFINKL